MRPEIAIQYVDAFEERFSPYGKGHLYFACHAAFPLALTPDLLYLLWANFQRDVDRKPLNIPWIAVADLLLSGLCDEVGYEMYEIKTPIRNELLRRLVNDPRFGQPRLEELGQFLLAYVERQLERHPDQPHIKTFAEVQKWTVLAYTKPSQAARQLALKLRGLVKQENGIEQIRMSSVIETLAEPLVASGFEPLVVYARGMADFVRGDVEKAASVLGEEARKGDGQIKVAGVRLPILRQSNPTTLDLSNNRLQQFPSEIANLTYLTSLDLSNNQLTQLPPEIANLTQLISLNLSNNQLTQLPPELANLVQLTSLDLSNNQFSQFPLVITRLTNLTNLNLVANQLSSLPVEIRQLTNLKKLDLRRNPLPIPPEILARHNEPATIISYYFRERKKPLNEAKVVFVGSGGVGKTSLVRRLVENQLDEQERITEGISIKDWSVTINDEQIKLNMWDFGGQEIMHATHRFFLTQRTLYLLVLDARLGEIGSRLDYWLNLIQSFGADSPIIVVSNKIDQHQIALNQRALREKYPTIKAFVNTSCKTGEGIPELKAQITRLIDEMVHVRDLIPAQWLEIKAELEGISRNYIPYRQYVSLCQAKNIRDAKEQRVLIRLLHDLGVVLHFADDPRLSETTVFNPAWLTGAVYQIINATPIAQNKGILEIGQLNDILDRERYPREEHLFIIDLMRKFELCFDLEGHRDEMFLIPDLLPMAEPELVWPTDNLNFEYHYEFLPRSVISRFMVRMHNFVFENTYWRNGVVLVNNANQAVVKALPRNKKIVISISGPQQGRLKFWTMIREQFDQIHQSIEGLNATLKIPIYKPPKCPNCGAFPRRASARFCSRCGTALSAYPASAATIDYSFLLELQEKGIEHYPTLSGNEIVVVDIRELLESIKSARQPTDSQEQAAWRKHLASLRLRVHPQEYYTVAFSLGQLYYEEMEYTFARQALVDGHEAIQVLRGWMQEDVTQVQLSVQSFRLYEMLVDCCIKEGHYDRAFEYAAVAKGRAFVSRLAEARVDLQSLAAERPDFASKLAASRQKRRQIDELERQISGEGANRDELLGQQSVLLREEVQLWREMERDYPVLTATLTVQTLSAAQARNLAQTLGATLVEYYHHAGGWCAFVIMADEIRYVPLPNLNDDLLNRMINWRNNIHRPSGRTHRRLRYLRDLYEAAIAPLALEGERVIIAPFERLHLLPLSAGYDPTTKRYLAEDHTLSYIPSLTALYVLNQERKRHQWADKPVQRLLSVAYPGPPRNYLPNVLDEAMAIVQRLSKVATIGVLHKEEATPDNVIREAPHYNIIHFGCNSRFDSQKAEESGLMLAGEALTVQRIITELNLKSTGLVTLAACLTGQVALREGEEHVGSLQALMTAGAQTVVANLWYVDDSATRVLFEALYTAIAQGVAPAQALREAAGLIRQQKPWRHPFYWAAFQVYGLSPDTPNQSVAWPSDLLESIEKAYIMSR